MPRNGFHRSAAFGIFTVSKCSAFQSLLFIAIGSIVLGAGILTPVEYFFAYYYGVLADVTEVPRTDHNCGHWGGHSELTCRPICRPSLFENAAPCMNGRVGEAAPQRQADSLAAGNGMCRLLPHRCVIQESHLRVARAGCEFTVKCSF